MYLEERQQAIAHLVMQHGRVTVNEVALSFGVTTETVRRDLAQLERAGRLRRVHGGAVSTATLTAVEPGLADRDGTRAHQKDLIAKAALAMLPPYGGSMLLDAGTTTARLAGLLPVDQQLHVITHAVPIAAQLAAAPGCRLHVVGGAVRGTTQAAVGPDAVRTYTDLRADVAFVATNGFSPQHGLTTPNADEAAVKRALVTAGRRVVVLADSAKLGREDLVRFATTSQVHVLVTDDGIGAEDLAALRAAGVEVVVA